MKSSFLSLTFLFILFLITSMDQSALAQWSTSPFLNNAVSTAPGYQDAVVMTSDGAGGAIFAWRDERVGNYDIYAQRINVAGIVQWASTGVPICTETHWQGLPVIVSDGEGGAIITWQDTRALRNDLYAQRISAAGVVQWTENGVSICSRPGGNHMEPSAASDGAGGAIITWYDSRNGNNDIYAQRINGAGVVLWTTDGIAVCTDSNEQQLPEIVSDGAGGAIVAWLDYRSTSSYDIYAQRINSDSTVRWTDNGVAVCAAAGDQGELAIASDASGGAIITWQDWRSGPDDTHIFAQHINGAGVARWRTDGAGICTVTGGCQVYPAIVGDGLGGSIITWGDSRLGNYDIYAQHVNADSSVRWAMGGVPVCTATNNQYYATIVNDGTGGTIITWQDHRNGPGSMMGYNDIYAQRVSGTGVPQWTGDGVAISTPSGDQAKPLIVSDGAGGAIITWSDGRDLTFRVYSQNVDQHGYLGKMEPKIRAVRDVKSDQGGKVVIMWDPSPLDVWPQQVLSSYTIYRGMKLSTMPYDRPHSVRGEHKPGDAVPSANGESIYWEQCATVSPHWLSGYSYPVATLSDSTAMGNPVYYFLVTAIAHDSLKYWDSSPDSGYSIDNLPPSAPSSPALVLLAEGPIRVEWMANVTDPDVGGYNIYRSESSGFPLTTGNKLALLSDTLYVDYSTQVGHKYFYRVTTEDIHGNESEPSPELSAIALPLQLTAFNASISGGRTTLIEWTVASEVNVFGYAIERRPANSAPWARVGWIQALGTSDSPHRYTYKDRVPQTGDFCYRLNMIDKNGASRISNEIAISVTVPHELRLAQNYPNPFNPSTKIEFTVPDNGRAMLTVHDALGKEVATLFNGETEPGRFYEAIFDGKDVATGVYFARLAFGDKQVVKKLLLMK